MADDEQLPISELMRRDPATLSLDELRRALLSETALGAQSTVGEMPLEVHLRREKGIDSPAFMATSILDPWYEKHFERVHYVLLDEVLGPWVIGETVRLDGVNYSPLDYTGIIVLWSRSTLKSTLLRIIAQWTAVYRKLRQGVDSRTMFVHQVIDKAVEHSEAIRACARWHAEWRRHYPEFVPPPDREWDRINRWRWPCFESFMATEWSFTCYGESSSKEGGHYTERFADDWVVEGSCTTDYQLQQSYDNFVKMDNLRDRAQAHNPWIAAGTNYHHRDTYRRLEERGGWFVWRVPAHTGSPRKIFDICSIEDKSPEGKRAIEKALKDLERDPPGDLNFPKLLPWRECYRTARQTGPITYNGQILLNPTPETEYRFDSSALAECWEDEIPGVEEMWLFLRCDPAISIKRSADETAYVMGGVDWRRWRWILDGWIGREKRTVKIAEIGFGLVEKWQKKGYRVLNMGYEAVQFQEALAQIARDGIPERAPAYQGDEVAMRLAPTTVVSITRAPDRTKHDRLVSMDGPISRRELRFWKGCSIAKKVMQQFVGYPHDRYDALDACHDLWVRTSTPPMPLSAEEDALHPILREIAMRGSRTGFHGGTAQVALRGR